MILTGPLYTEHSLIELVELCQLSSINEVNLLENNVLHTHLLKFNTKYL